MSLKKGRGVQAAFKKVYLSSSIENYLPCIYLLLHNNLGRTHHYIGIHLSTEQPKTKSPLHWNPSFFRTTYEQPTITLKSISLQNNLRTTHHCIKIHLPTEQPTNNPPLHWNPSPEKPALHVHVLDPGVFVHFALE